MLYGELKIYRDGEVVKIVGDEDFSEFNAKQLNDFVHAIVAETGADKAISSCVYHGGAQGTINTVLFPMEDNCA